MWLWVSVEIKNKIYSIKEMISNDWPRNVTQKRFVIVMCLFYFYFHDKSIPFEKHKGKSWTETEACDITASTRGQ